MTPWIQYGAKLYGSAEQGQSRKGKRGYKLWANEALGLNSEAGNRYEKPREWRGFRSDWIQVLGSHFFCASARARMPSRSSRFLSSNSRIWATERVKPSNLNIIVPSAVWNGMPTSIPLRLSDRTALITSSGLSL